VDVTEGAEQCLPREIRAKKEKSVIPNNDNKESLTPYAFPRQTIQSSLRAQKIENNKSQRRTFLSLRKKP
jgi:hypothetical protein